MIALECARVPVDKTTYLQPATFYVHSICFKLNTSTIVLALLKNQAAPKYETLYPLNINVSCGDSCYVQCNGPTNRCRRASSAWLLYCRAETRGC